MECFMTSCATCVLIASAIIGTDGLRPSKVCYKGDIMYITHVLGVRGNNINNSYHLKMVASVPSTKKKAATHVGNIL